LITARSGQLRDTCTCPATGSLPVSDIHEQEQKTGYMDPNSSKWQLFNVKMQPDFGWKVKGNSNREINSAKIFCLHPHIHHNALNPV